MKKILLFVLSVILLFLLSSCKPAENHPPQTQQLENNISSSDVTIQVSHEETDTANPVYSSPENIIKAYVSSLLNNDLNAYIELLSAPEKAISEHNNNIKWNRFGVMLQAFNSDTPYDKTSFYTETITDNKMSEEDLNKYTLNYKLNLLPEEERSCVVSEGRELDVIVNLSNQNKEKITRTISLILLNENGKWKIHHAAVLPPNFNS